MLAPDYPIVTPRLRLRRFRRDDTAAVLSMHSREDVTRYLYWGPRSEAQVVEWLDRAAAHTTISAEGDWLQVAAERASDGALIGHGNLAYVSAEHRHGAIGYLVHPDHQGLGYATEIARALLGLGFATLGLHRISGEIEAGNAASARVLEHIGMRREAHLIENEWVKGEWQSAVIYAILEHEWKA